MFYYFVMIVLIHGLIHRFIRRFIHRGQRIEANELRTNSVTMIMRFLLMLMVVL